MQPLRKPPFLVALVAVLLSVLVDLGGPAILGHTASAGGAAAAAIDAELDGMDLDAGDRDAMRQELAATQRQAKPPGRAIPTLALLDGLLVFATLSLAFGWLFGERLHVKIQGILTLIVAIVGGIGAFMLLIAAFVATLIMVALFTAAPFGTLTYLALYGSFDRGGASVVLSANMLLKIIGAVALIVAQPRHLGMKMLVFLILTCLVANVLTSFLHGLVPIILVSITDGVSAIVIAILALVWAIVFLVAGILSVFKLVL